ncbi:MAG: glucose-6-phosphate dehydrogenase [Kiritimatiellae bacterium]|nr:glucose-6-phosphate dehydrogenase [Kiritimatiellia bacterium]
MPASPPDSIAFIIAGASGDLATRKVMPALFALHARGLLPAESHFYGYARSALTDQTFRARLQDLLQCEDLPGDACDVSRRDFLERCHYEAGDYDDAAAMSRLLQRIAAAHGANVHRLYYLAVPPSLFATLAATLRMADSRCGADARTAAPWLRVVIEKPFGRDRATSDELTAALLRVFNEEQIYRIDHYLGKEAVQNLMVLRFANTVFEPLWNRNYVRHVHIEWAEDLSLAGRAGYFDGAGILRDVVQNHLTQMLALVAMECPWSLDAKHIRDEKVRLLRQVAPLTRDRVVLGQYTAGILAGHSWTGYRDEPGVPPASRTATYAAAVLEVRSPRWRGVPFLISAGKGLDCRRTEIRIHFKGPEHDLFRQALLSSGVAGAPLPDNELVIRVQPDEQIYLRIAGKTPGLEFHLDTPKLDLIYREAYAGKRIGDAYENLLLDVVRGDRSLFIRGDELEAAWDIFTPLLHDLDATSDEPSPYAFGSRGPEARDLLARRFGIEDA